MRYIYSLFFINVIVLIVACDFSQLQLDNRDAIDSISIERYDREEARYLTTGDFSALQSMNTVYHKQTRALIEDILKLGSVSDARINKQMLEFYQDSILQDVIHAAESQYADMTDLNKYLKKAFGNLRRDIPHIQIPTFYTQIGAFNQSIVVDDKAIGISLDKYLGEDYPAYQKFYDKQQRLSMRREYIVPDCMVFYLFSIYGVTDYQARSQYFRDMRMAVVMWVVNRECETDIFDLPFIKKVDDYMKSNPDTTIEQLLCTTDFSNF